MPKLKLAVLLLVLAIVASLPAGALAQAASTGSGQDYPNKPVRMIAPYPPGGSSDVLARIVAQKLSEALGRPVVVENRPGAAANVGHEIAAKATPDGYTLLLTSAAALVTNQFLYKKLNFDPRRDFVPISLVATAAPMLVVHPSLPAKSVQELIAYAKTRPGQLNFGSGGVGTTSHIVGEVFQTATGVKMVHVPYKGGVLAVADLVAGQIQLSFADMVPSVPQVKAGKLRALAVTSERRSGALPDVLTMAEAGVKAEFPGQWWAIVAPRGTPDAIIRRLNADVAQMVKAPDVQEKYAAMGIFTEYTTPERMSELQASGTRLMARVVKAAGIQPE
jgi:tripartite-type tricarboxylate transporter receptor subunit TctC